MSLQLTFGGVASMEAFKDRLERMKRAFAPIGAPPLKPVDLMNKLFQLAEAHLANQATPLPTSSTSSPATAVQHFLPSAGRNCVKCCEIHVHVYMSDISVC